ncbi:MAG TPA: nucleotidyltransferase family protein [Pseudonocardiaceae bacterium]|nr:nucleotidyltransferase family protein [Pseudonocardiaceae bacterium]
MTSDVAGLLLAAGAGRRMGMPKALVTHGGMLFVESAAGVLTSAGCRPVVVVLGASAETVRAQAELGECLVVDNPNWSTGMGSSVRVGLAALPDVTAVVVLPVDVPGVTPAAVARLMGVAGPDVLARASYDGVPGHPVVIGRSHWPGVAESAVGDVGARDYLRSHDVLDVPCADVAVGTDVDRPEDLQQLGT